MPETVDAAAPPPMSVDLRWQSWRFPSLLLLEFDCLLLSLPEAAGTEEILGFEPMTAADSGVVGGEYGVNGTGGDGVMGVYK